MSTWLDKPDADGLWWRCEDSSITLCVVRSHRYGFALFSDGTSCVDSNAYAFANEKTKWQRCELTRPEPYKPPVPPKVEWYTASGGKRFIVQTPLEWVAFDSDGYRCNTGSGKCSDYYTDIKPLEAPP